jgi:hypothetical protein
MLSWKRPSARETEIYKKEAESEIHTRLLSYSSLTTRNIFLQGVQGMPSHHQPSNAESLSSTCGSPGPRFSRGFHLGYLFQALSTRGSNFIVWLHSG